MSINKIKVPTNIAWDTKVHAAENNHSLWHQALSNIKPILDYLERDPALPGLVIWNSI